MQVRFPEHTFELSGVHYPYLENSIIAVRGSSSDPEDADHFVMHDIPAGETREVKEAFQELWSAARGWKAS